MNLLKKFALFFASGAGFGYFPIASGTVGALWGIPLYLLLYNLSKKFDPQMKFIGWSVYLLCTFLIFILGIYASDIGAKHWKNPDPGKVVIDEIVGFLLTMTLISPKLEWIIGGFILSRILDIIKIWPARLVDKTWQNGLGIMMDDAISGMQGALILNLIRLWL